ncbi:hypothetical protein SAMN05444421_10162 [Celeribacter marinus]|nr:hypothetical protein SAMN05444421_10162 [Celeribacter marinus]
MHCCGADTFAAFSLIKSAVGEKSLDENCQIWSLAVRETFILYPSPIRRWFSTAMMLCLGALLVYVALTTGTMVLFWKLVLAVFGFASLFSAMRVWNATATHLVLTQDALEEAEGRVLCRIDDIEKVERGAFALKPSNGFVVVLKSKTQLTWAPGLWWRFGRRVGVGGVTPAGETKAMADILASRLLSDTPIA